MGHSAFISTFPVCHLIGAAELGSGYVSFLPINQPSHGFVQDDWVYYSGAPYAKAKADAFGTIAWGVVGRVIDPNWFELVLGGIVDSTAHGLGSAGDEIYLSQGTAGAEVSSIPASGVVQPLGLILNADQYYVGILQAEAI